MPHQDHYRNGVKLVSVTELMSIINKPFLEKWKRGLCSFQMGQCGFVAAEQVADEAADLGNKVHEDVAEYLKNNEMAKTPWGFKIAEKLKEMGVQKYLIDPESTLIDQESGLAGSPDFVGTLENEFLPPLFSSDGFIGDLKIKNSLDPLTGMQGCGYRYLIKRMHGVDISQMLVIWAKKKTKSQLVEAVWIDLNDWYEDWKALVKLWNRLNPKRIVTIHE